MKAATASEWKQPRRRGRTWSGCTFWLVLITAALAAFLTGCGGLATEDLDSGKSAAGNKGWSEDFSGETAPHQADGQDSHTEPASSEMQFGTRDPADSTAGPWMSDSDGWLVTKESVKTGIFTLDYGQKGSIVEENTESGLEKRWVSSKDGADVREALQVQVSADGTWTFEYPNGMKSEYRADQSMKVTDPIDVRISIASNGETVTEIPDGTVQTRRNDGTLLTDYPDGTFSTLVGSTSPVITDAQVSSRIQFPFGVSITLRQDEKGYSSEKVQDLPIRGQVSYSENGNVVIAYPGNIQLTISADGRNEVSFPNGVRIVTAGIQHEYATIHVPDRVEDSVSPDWSGGDVRSALFFVGIKGRTAVIKGGNDFALAVEYPDGTKRTTYSRGAVKAEYPGGVIVESDAGQLKAVLFSDMAVPEAAFPVDISAVVKVEKKSYSDADSTSPVSNYSESPSPESPVSPASSDMSNPPEVNTAVSDREEDVPSYEWTETDSVPDKPDKSKEMLSGIIIRTILLAAVCVLVIIGIIYMIYLQNLIKEERRQLEEARRKWRREAERANQTQSGPKYVEDNPDDDSRGADNSSNNPKTGWGISEKIIKIGERTSQARFGTKGSEEPGKDGDILLVIKNDGELIGEISDGSYDVRPVMDNDSDNELSGYINERILRHSAVSACFEIVYNGHEGSKYRINIDSLARLNPVKKKIKNSTQEYTLGHKGIITVTDAW